jgi:SHS2 domain-containing protein
MDTFSFIFTSEAGITQLGGDREFEAQGHDLESLLHDFLTELLVDFESEGYFVCRELLITTFDRNNWKIVAKGYAL